MKSIVPDGRGGACFVEKPMPSLFDGAALCRATHSLVSTGTERMIIRRNVGKTPDAIAQEDIRLGYCGAGIVEEIRGALPGIAIGQPVVYYGGPYISHSEYNVVPRALLHPIPDVLDPAEAAFTGIGAIALHGFRKVRLALDETCFVMGAGIIGNLCAQLAVAAGCRVVVSDPDAERLAMLRSCVGLAADLHLLAPEAAKVAVTESSDGLGADGVLICASVDSAAPMEQAVEVAAAGGRIVVVGVFDIHVPRELFFQREAEITISRAAGPGRYDSRYERDGIDYPPQYARWTEGRNLGTVLHLLASGKIDVAPLISGRYPIEEAPAVYAEIMAGRDKPGYLFLWPRPEDETP